MKKVVLNLVLFASGTISMLCFIEFMFGGVSELTPLPINEVLGEEAERSLKATAYFSFLVIYLILSIDKLNAQVTGWWRWWMWFSVVMASLGVMTAMMVI